MRKTLPTIALSVALATVLSGQTAAHAASMIGGSTAMLTSSAASAQDADWILRAQLPSGAIATQVDRAHIEPYFANFAAKGLALAAADTGDVRYSAAAWRWLQWYAAHQDVRGYVTDYDVSSKGSEISTGSMDSTDSYAGTFLIAAQETYRVTRDLPKLVALQRAIAAAVSAIESTQDIDGLTWAKPAWRVKYLMDQTEAFGGLQAAAVLADAMGNLALAARARSAAQRMYTGVGALWNPATASYDWAQFANGARQVTNWNRLYPDAAQQPWAVAFGLVPATRGAALMSHFSAVQPNWDRPEALATYDTGSARAGYWPVIGSAFLVVGNRSRATSAYDRIRTAAVTANRAWPFNVGPAGQLLIRGHG